MSRLPQISVHFADEIELLAGGQVWEYESGSQHACSNAAEATYAALQQPEDFPPMSSAIVAGDRVVLAIDPNVPAVIEVVRGTLKALAETDVSQIEIVLWDEATDETLEAVRDAVGSSARVVRHLASERKSLCYLGADEIADPIYLNRSLVEADFVLPIVAGRPLDVAHSDDVTGIYPELADSASRIRYRNRLAAPRRSQTGPMQRSEIGWLLGVQMMVCVIASVSGEAAEVVAGTPDAIGKRLTSTRRKPDIFPPSAPLVIASLDGNLQQQTWSNAVRAIVAASRYAQAGGTIVLWSAIDVPPSGLLVSGASADADENVDDSSDEAPSDSGSVDQESSGDFPAWDSSIGLATILSRIAAEYRLLIHSRLDEETVELMGFASVRDTEELGRLSRSFEACGVLRAAQYQSSLFQLMPLEDTASESAEI